MRRLCFLLLVFLIGSGAARAQTDTFSPELKPLAELYGKGFNDELVSNISARIAATAPAERPHPDPRLLYYRGLAYAQMGWLDEAKADLTRAQKAGISNLWGQTDVNKELQFLARQKALLPPHMEEVREGDRVICRMYYTEINEDTALVKATLRDAYRINREIFGTDVEGIPVYVFDDFSQFLAFYKELEAGQNPGSWVDCVTIGGKNLISLRNAQGASRAKNNPGEFQKILVHEFNHAMFYRLIGARKVPGWFTEGLAQVAGAREYAKFDGDQQKTLRRIFANNALLSFDELNDEASFVQQAESGLTQSRGRDADSAPAPYTQGYSMTKYLVDHVSPAQLQSFLNRVRASGDFKASFDDEFDFPLKKFYQSWEIDTANQLAVQ